MVDHRSRVVGGRSELSGQPSASSSCIVMRLDDNALRQGVADLRWRLPQLLAGGHPTLVIDISGVERISSTTVAAILWVKRRCRGRRVRVVVRDPSRRSLEQLRRTGLMDAFDIESSESDEGIRRGAVPSEHARVRTARAAPRRRRRTAVTIRR